MAITLFGERGRLVYYLSLALDPFCGTPAIIVMLKKGLNLLLRLLCREMLSLWKASTRNFKLIVDGARTSYCLIGAIVWINGFMYDDRTEEVLRPSH